MFKMLTSKKRLLKTVKKYKKIVKIVQSEGGHIYDKYMKVVRVVYDETDD